MASGTRGDELVRELVAGDLRDSRRAALPVGVLVGSTVSAVLATVVLRLRDRHHRRSR